ncbi:MAG: hypothetical protein KDB27_29035, partial [Planctomycetales bacterium]|nr:hypothetical protein [Planctomycetales bacterium]
KVTVTFDKPIDAATFTAEDARLELTGGKIDAANVQQIDEQAFDVYFPTPEMAGLYNFYVGPSILATNQIPMNQTEDAFNGLSDDVYSGLIFVDLDPVQIPYTQTFTSPDITTLGGWMFHTINESGTRAGGEWRITGDFDPFGEYHLQQTQFADCWSQHDGILALDVNRLANTTDLVLEFDMSRTSNNPRKSDGGSRNMGQLLVGSSATSMVQVGGPEFLLDTEDGIERFGDLNGDGITDLVPQFDDYVHYKFDLDELLAASGTEVNGTIYVNFHRLSFYSTDVTVFDNIRIYDSSETTVAPIVESVTLHDRNVPNSTVIDNIEIQFDMPVQGFELDDLKLERDGQQIAFAPATQLESTDNQHWVIAGLLDSVLLPGEYKLTLDPGSSQIFGNNGGLLDTGFSQAWTDSRIPGDANFDGMFNSRDLVLIFQANEYEDDVSGNSTWSEGDWNGDGDFTTADLVAAFQAGSYVAAVDVVLHKSLFGEMPSHRRFVARNADIDAAIADNDWDKDH